MEEKNFMEKVRLSLEWNSELVEDKSGEQVEDEWSVTSSTEWLMQGWRNETRRLTLTLTLTSRRQQKKCPRPHRAKALSDDARLTSVAYIGPKSRTEKPRKAKIGTELAHVTRDTDTTFKVKRSKVNLQGVGAYCGGLPDSLLFLLTVANKTYMHTCIISHFTALRLRWLFAQRWLAAIGLVRRRCLSFVPLR